MLKYLGTIIGMIIIVVVAVIYNMLVKARNKVKEAYSSMDISLKKRWDIVPNLVEVVKGYSAYEKSTLEKLTLLRQQAYDKFEMKQKLDVDNNIAKVVSKMLAIAENYPDLRADEEYLKLSEQLMNLENEIAKARKEYNEAVNKYNTQIEVVPNNLVAILFGFNEEQIFEAKQEEKENIKIDLKEE